MGYNREERGVKMNKYVIDYEYGIADFFTEATDEKEVRRKFYNCANCCFGIRKSIGGYTVKETYLDVALPIPYRDKGGTQFLSHNGDEILFNDHFKTSNGEPWKLMNEHGDWCSCQEMGKEELSCNVHHFWVKDHNKLCDCQNK